MNVAEFEKVKIDGNVYDIDVYGLEYINYVIDHKDEYGFGESKTVIIDFDFDLVVIYLYDGQVEIDTHNPHWASVSKQVKEYIFSDYDFMEEWQEQEFGK